ncbi:MAG: hypothetical protein HUU01_11735 [Saprospiraceae bacterium]|nr:hypothetical protein [Saprospiraceae bacterium]
MAKKHNDEKNDGEAALGSFDIRVNEFGEIITNIDIESLNDFLNKNVEDKKFKDRPDYQASLEEE